MRSNVYIHIKKKRESRASWYCSVAVASIVINILSFSLARSHLKGAHTTRAIDITLLACPYRKLIGATAGCFTTSTMDTYTHIHTSTVIPLLLASLMQTKKETLGRIALIYFERIQSRARLGSFSSVGELLRDIA